MPDRGETSPCPTPPELGDFLRGVEFPIGRDELLEQVEGTDAPQGVRQALEALEPQDFETPAEVQQAVDALSR